MSLCHGLPRLQCPCKQAQAARFWIPLAMGGGLCRLAGMHSMLEAACQEELQRCHAALCRS